MTLSKQIVQLGTIEALNNTIKFHEGQGHLQTVEGVATLRFNCLLILDASQELLRMTERREEVLKEIRKKAATAGETVH